MEPATIQQLFHENCVKFGDKIAFQRLENEDAFKTFTYNDVWKTAGKIAAFLLQRGVGPQEYVGIYAPNSPEWAMAAFGILINNSTIVPLDPKNGRNELLHIIRDAGIRYIFSTVPLAPHLADFALDGVILFPGAPSAGDSPTQRVFLFSDIESSATRGVDFPPASPTDVATVIYTSGTTAQPKGVMLTHESILADIRGIVAVFPVGENDRFLSVIVLSHAYELCVGLFLPFSIGAQVTYSASLKYTTILKNMRLARPTVMCAVPQLFTLLLDALLNKIRKFDRLAGKIDPEEEAGFSAGEIAQVRDLLGGNARFFVSGGAPLEKTVAAAFFRLGVPLLQVYGLTETSPVLTMTRVEDNKLRSVGRPLPGVEIRIMKEAGSDIGEICARGKNLMKGYHNNPKLTAQTIRQGWLHTGDLGYLDAEGCLFITGRRKNIIVTSAGVNVFPEELEERIGRSPIVREVCVIGKQSPDLTEKPHAVVVIREEAYEAYARSEKEAGREPGSMKELVNSEIQKHTDDLAVFKKIHDFQIRTRELPRGRTGKIMRNEVKREAFSIDGRLGRLVPSKKSQALALVNGSIVTPFRIAKSECIIIENGKISQFGKKDSVFLTPDIRIIDAEGMYIVPGFMDLHIHGGKGFSFNNFDPLAFREMEDFYIAHGTTRMLATLYLEEKGKMLETISSIVAYMEKHRDSTILAGIHMEGPYLNKEMKGALNEAYIWEPTIESWLELAARGKKCIKLMTIAPEIPGALDVMRMAAQEGIVLSIAHSRARYEDIEVAIDNGLSQVTHIFNAMSPIHHRKPGVLVGALLKKELKVQLIADGVHVHPAVMKLLYQLKKSDGIILITDAIIATGLPDGTFEMGGKTFTVRGGTALQPDNTLSGSTLTLEDAVKTMVEKVDVPLTEAVRMASLNPARVLGLDHDKGVLSVGKDADMVLLDKRFAVEMTIIGGEIRYSRTTVQK